MKKGETIDPEEWPFQASEAGKSHQVQVVPCKGNKQEYDRFSQVKPYVASIGNGVQIYITFITRRDRVILFSFNNYNVKRLNAHEIKQLGSKSVYQRCMRDQNKNQQLMPSRPTLIREAT